MPFLENELLQLTVYFFGKEMEEYNQTVLVFWQIYNKTQKFFYIDKLAKMSLCVLTYKMWML